MWGRCTVVGEFSEHGTVLERSASPSIARYSRSTDCIFLPISNVKEIERRLIEGMFCFCFDVLASRSPRAPDEIARLGASLRLRRFKYKARPVSTHSVRRRPPPAASPSPTPPTLINPAARPTLPPCSRRVAAVLVEGAQLDLARRVVLVAHVDARLVLGPHVLLLLQLLARLREMRWRRRGRGR